MVPKDTDNISNIKAQSVHLGGLLKMYVCAYSPNDLIRHSLHLKKQTNKQKQRKI